MMAIAINSFLGATSYYGGNMGANDAHGDDQKRGNATWDGHRFHLEPMAGFERTVKALGGVLARSTATSMG